MFSGKNEAWALSAADDPSDWGEEFHFLRNLDASLRCDLCYVGRLASRPASFSSFLGHIHRPSLD